MKKNMHRAPHEDLTVFIGSYAEMKSKGLYVCSFDQTIGEIKIKEAISGILNPSYFCLNFNSSLLFAISEYKEGNKGKVTSYQCPEEKQLQKLTEIVYNGAGSCYIAINKQCSELFVANYISGSVGVFRVLNDGTTISPLQTLNFEGSGPNRERQMQSHLHAVVLSTDETLLYCTDLGADRLYAFNYKEGSEAPLDVEEPQFLNLPAGSGPRHIVCNPNGKWFYLLCELSGDIFLFNQGKLQPWIQQCNVVGKENNGKIEAGDIQTNAKGTYLYATNRGDANELIVFRIDQLSGKLTCIQHISSHGESPRCIALDPTENFLLAACEQGNTISVFSISQIDGTLTYINQSLHIDAPTCIKFGNNNYVQ